MKRAITSIIMAFMLFSLVSCNVGNNDKSEDIPSNTEESNMTGETSEVSVEEYSESISEIESESEKYEYTVVDNVKLISPAANATVVLSNDTLYDWWKNFHWVKTDSTPFYTHEDTYFPVPVTFEWEEVTDAEYYVLYVAKNSEMNDSDSYILNENSFAIDNLFVGTDYYWRVDAVCVDRTYRSEIGYFKSADSPRALNIEGVSNTRDIGGMAAADGYRIKQGMIYRGGKLDQISASGIEYFRNDIGVTTDLDLRTPGEGGAGDSSPLGEDIKYVNIDGRYYVGSKGINNELGKTIMAEEIRLFADPENYPIYIHCSLGRDRTGTLAFLIEALLGVNKNTLMMDYELSVFSVTGTLDNASVMAIRNNIQATYNYINDSFEGDNFAEKTENYLLGIGITDEEIATIKALLLEEVK